MNTKLFLLTLILFILSIYSYSQKDFKPAYIIKNGIDTIYGTGNISVDHEYCLFKRIHAQKHTKIYPDEIDAFRIIEGKYYVSREIQEENEKIHKFFEIFPGCIFTHGNRHGSKPDPAHIIKRSVFKWNIADVG